MYYRCPTEKHRTLAGVNFGDWSENVLVFHMWTILMRHQLCRIKKTLFTPLCTARSMKLEGALPVIYFQRVDKSFRIWSTWFQFFIFKVWIGFDTCLVREVSHRKGTEGCHWPSIKSGTQTTQALTVDQFNTPVIIIRVPGRAVSSFTCFTSASSGRLFYSGCELI